MKGPMQVIVTLENLIEMFLSLSDYDKGLFFAGVAARMDKPTRDILREIVEAKPYTQKPEERP